jgi:hypothetical protein
MDKIKVYPQERLDIVDVDALQTLVYNYVQEAMGSLIGPARGCLSQPSVTFIDGTPDKISLSDFSFVASKAIGSSIFGNKTKYNNFASQIVKFDSTLLDHGNYPISLTGVDTTMFLWARPLMVDTDLANRRKWDVAQGAEVTFSDETRSRMRVEFAFSATDPTINGDDFQYSPIAKVTTITGSLILLTFISAFDSADIQAVTGESGTFYDSSNTSATAFSGMLPTYRLDDANVNTGLLSVVHALGRMVRQMHAKGENDPSGTSNPLQWYNTQPKISLNGAYKAIDTLETDVNFLFQQTFFRNVVPFAYWIVEGSPNEAYKWRVVRGTTTTMNAVFNMGFEVSMTDEMKTGNGFLVNGFTVEQARVSNVLNRVEGQLVWFSTATSNADWLGADSNLPSFTFDLNTITTSHNLNEKITLLITLHGRPLI